MSKYSIHTNNNIPELNSPFEQLREVDVDGKEWWNSRKLAQVMGYGKYWNFERVIAKAAMLPLWSICMLSWAKVEKVVKPPHTPVVSSRHRLLFSEPFLANSASHSHDNQIVVLNAI